MLNHYRLENIRNSKFFTMKSSEFGAFLLHFRIWGFLYIYFTVLAKASFFEWSRIRSKVLIICSIILFVNIYDVLKIKK